VHFPIEQLITEYVRKSDCERDKLGRRCERRSRKGSDAIAIALER
jgi:hypothetical protein